MTQNEFENLLDKRGSDIVQWTDLEERELVQKLLSESAEARELLAKTQNLYQLIDRALEAPEPVGLESRILGRIKEQEQRDSSWTIWFLNWILKPVAFAAIPLAIGFALSMVVEDSAPVVEDELIYVHFEEPLIAFE